MGLGNTAIPPFSIPIGSTIPIEFMAVAVESDASALYLRQVSALQNDRLFESYPGHTECNQRPRSCGLGECDISRHRHGGSFGKIEINSSYTSSEI